MLAPIRIADNNQAAVVFIHGFGGEAFGTWARFPEWLAAEKGLADWSIYTLGYESHLRFDVLKLWSADPDLKRVATMLGTEARLGALKPFKTLCLVAHSMGGLVLQRALLDEASLRERTSHVFLYGTPSNGLLKASWGRLFKPQLRNMARDGEFIRTLRGDWSTRFERDARRPLPFSFYACAGERDEFVPAESSLGPFPAERYPDRCCVVPGNHVEMVKPASASHLSVQVLVKGLRGDAAPAGPMNAARLAVQSRDFARAVELLEPNSRQLDEEGRVQLALALEGVGRQDDAVALLKEHGGAGTDALGTLAGRLKRRWLVSRVEADAHAALGLYDRALTLAQAAGRPSQVYYHAINVAFMQLAFEGELAAAKASARLAAQACDAARANERAVDRKWRFATEGEAALLLGDAAAAGAAYRQAAAPAQGADPRELQSMYQQAVVVSRSVGDEALRRELTAIFRPDA